MSGKINIEAIDDVTSTVDTSESYIKDLENEITQLNVKISKLEKKLKEKPKQQDISCCEAYNILLKNFHKLLDDMIPF